LIEKQKRELFPDIGRTGSVRILGCFMFLAKETLKLARPAG
jgi:CRISPR/Cas system CMR-associated protein Cmr3 (group 5 of RAMP superfamily)